MTAREIRAPRGTGLTCRSWPQEAAMRMLMNNLDPDVAERPEDLVVYGGTGRAARSWEAFDAIVRSLRGLSSDETLLVQSGKPVGVFRTHEMAPRVLISNAMLVPKWADWDTFRELEQAGLTMYGQMTAGSWIYIGTQGILQGTYETLAECASQRFDGTLRGRVVLTAGLGGMGGPPPLAVTMNEGVALVVEVDPARIERRIKTRYLDRETADMDEALRWVQEARDGGEALSVGLLGNASETHPELLRRGFRPDVVTDQTSAHDPLGGYIPGGLTLEEADELRDKAPDAYVRGAKESMARQVEAMVGLQDAGAVVFDYGNNLRAGAQEGGCERAYDYRGFVPNFIRPMFCEGKGPFRWVALSGDPEDILKTDRAVEQLFPNDERLARWLRLPAWASSATRTRATSGPWTWRGNAGSGSPGGSERPGAQPGRSHPFVTAATFDMISAVSTRVSRPSSTMTSLPTMTRRMAS